MADNIQEKDLENNLVAEESHHVKKNSKTGFFYSKKFIGFLILNVIVAYIVVIFLATKSPDVPQEISSSPEPEAEPSTVHKVHIKTGAVVSDHEKCSEIGRDMMLRGGSAVDSTIAALLCLGVLTSHSMGIGGGLFIVAYNAKTRKSEYFDGRETGPSHVTAETYKNTKGNIGARYIGIPGEIKTYWAAHQKYGKLPWKELFTPTIELARNGFHISNAVAKAIKLMETWMKKDNDSFINYPGFCDIYCDKDGNGLKEGTFIKATQLANTLEGISIRGPDYLYNSSLTDIIVKEVNDAVGEKFWDREDLVNYKVKQGSSLAVDLGRWTLYTLPDPSGGPVLGLIMNMFKELNLTRELMQRKPAMAYHLMIEAMKFAYSIRPRLSDGDFEPGVKDLVQKMISKELAVKLSGKVDRNRTHDIAYYTDSNVVTSDERGTAHISVMSPNGDAVSATSTINYYFGSLVRSNSTGIVWNNELADFRLQRDETKVPDINSIKPGKRPLSAMVPAIFVDKDGNVRLVIGAAGGSRITNVVAQVSARVLFMKENIEDAIRKKRLNHVLSPNVLKLEDGFHKEIVKELQQKYRHKTEFRERYMAVVEGIERCPVTGQISGFADPRKLPGRTYYTEDMIKYS